MYKFTRRLTRVGVLTLLAAALSAAPAAANGSAAVGHVYVNDNTRGVNTIAGFDRHADGTLTPLPGSPFAASGAGNGAGLASQGALQISTDGRYLLAVDPGSNQISVLRIRHDGSLRVADVISSGGALPDSIAEHAGLVYVANSGAGGSNYTGFRLGSGGRLRPLAGSTVPLPDTAGPGDVLFNSSGTNLAGTEVGTSLIDSFRVTDSGRLLAAPGSPFAAQGPGPFGSEFRPTERDQLFVSNAHGGPGAGTVSAFKVATDGTLASIGSSPFADGQTAPCWVEVTHDGAVLFTTNTASATISSYTIAANGALTHQSDTPTGSGPVDERLSPNGHQLYVVQRGADSLGAFAVSGSGLSSLGSFALPAGAVPAGLATN